MPKAAVYNLNGEQVGDIDLNEDIFGVEVNEPLLHQAVVRHLANQRQGTVSTKTRSEVRGGGRKPWRQKGTGRARHGSIRSPIWVGGGVTFGPKPRSFRQKMPKKAKRAALCSALSAKLSAGDMIVLDAMEIKEPKTKIMAELLKRIKAEKPLIVMAGRDEAVERSARNIPGVSILQANGLNVYDILKHPVLVMTKDSVTKVEEVLA